MSKNIIEGWPDVINCNQARDLSSQTFFWLHVGVVGGGSATYIQPYSKELRFVYFNSRGEYLGRQGPDVSTLGCLGQSIDQLNDLGRTFSFLSSRVNGGNDTMIQGWPDVMRCGSGKSDGAVFWLSRGSLGNSDDTARYASLYPLEDRHVTFNADGSYNSRGGNDASSKGCFGQSISQLYDRGDVANIVSSREKDESGVTSMVAGWPDAIRCGVNDNGSVFLLRAVNPSLAYYVQAVGDENVGDEYREVIFNSDGSYNSKVGSDESTSSCLGQSISQLSDLDRVYNFVSNKTNVSAIPERTYDPDASIVAGWPDVIRCGVGTSEAATFWLHGASSNVGAKSHYVQVYNGEHREVVFNSDGSYNSRSGYDLSSKGCLGQSIDQLYQSGRAEDTVTSKEPDSTGATTMIKGWPDAIRCSSSTTEGSVLWLNIVGVGEDKITSYYQNYNGEARYVEFKGDGSYHSRAGHDDTTKGCLGQSIEQLYGLGRALNMVNSKTEFVEGGVVEGWPDAIKCSNTEDDGPVLLMRGGGSAGIEYAQVYPHDNVYVRFNADGSYHSRGGSAAPTSGCLGQSISQLSEANKTFYFLGAPSTTSTSSTTTASSVTDTSVTATTTTGSSVTSVTETSATDSSTTGTISTGLTVSSVTSDTAVTETSVTELSTSHEDGVTTSINDFITSVAPTDSTTGYADTTQGEEPEGGSSESFPVGAAVVAGIAIAFIASVATFFIARYKYSSNNAENDNHGNQRQDAFVNPVYEAGNNQQPVPLHANPVYGDTFAPNAAPQQQEYDVLQQDPQNVRGAIYDVNV